MLTGQTDPVIPAPTPASSSAIDSGAILSTDRRYRYLLWRRWAGDSTDPMQSVVWLMMNPSTADALLDDATIRKCCGFARRWGYAGIKVVNLFALRSRQPSELLRDSDPVGPEYWTHLEATVAQAPELIAAWGCESTLKKGYHLRRHMLEVIQKVREWRPGIEVQCLGKSKFGTPYHPLMLSYDTPRKAMFDIVE